MPFQQALNTANTLWRQNTNQVAQQDGYIALLRALVHFAGGKATPGTVTYAGTGNGTIDDIDGGVDAPTETWTVTFSDATNFSVSGSVSGAQAAGTVDNNYTTTGNPLTSLISFRINSGGTAFQNGDAFTIPVTVGALASDGNQWILDRWSPFTTAGNGFNAIDDQTSIGTTGSLIWHGQGNGSEAFYAGISLTETPASQIWNLVHRMYTGFSASANWDIGVDPTDEQFTALWDNDMDYWFVVNARRYVVAAVVSTTMHAFYQGCILPFASPAEWPYPVAQFCEKQDEEAYNSTATSFGQGICNAQIGNQQLRDTSGNWLEATTITTWPFDTGSADGADQWWGGQLENMPSGDNQLVPITSVLNGASTIAPLTTMDVYGTLQGCFAVTGFNITPQTVLSIGGTAYLVVNNIFRLDRNDFWALELS